MLLEFPRRLEQIEGFARDDFRPLKRQWLAVIALGVTGATFAFNHALVLPLAEPFIAAALGAGRWQDALAAAAKISGQELRKTSHEKAIDWLISAEQLGDAANALTGFKKICESNRSWHDSRAIHGRLVDAYADLGRYPEAVKELEKAIDEKQPDGSILDHLGDAYEKTGNAAKARATWQRAKEALEKDKEPEKAQKIAPKLAKSK